MTYLSNFSLQQSLYQTLSGDSSLNTMISGVFDHVPQESAYPFVTIGECAVRDFSNALKQGTENRISLHIYSRAPGRKEASQIMERIVILLQNATLSVFGQQLISCRFTASAIALLDDGVTCKGTLQFAVRLTES